MDPQWGDILSSAGQTIQSYFDFITRTIAEMVAGFTQAAEAAIENAPRIFAIVPVSQALIAASVVIIIFAFRNRLRMRGMVLFVFGLIFLFVGLANLVNPAGMPLFLRT